MERRRTSSVPDTTQTKQKKQIKSNPNKQIKDLVKNAKNTTNNIDKTKTKSNSNDYKTNKKNISNTRKTHSESKKVSLKKDSNYNPSKSVDDVKRYIKPLSKTKVVAIFSLIIILTLSTVTFFVMTGTDIFNIKKINVVGTNFTKEEEIISKSNIKLQDNILVSYFKLNKEAILTEPYVSTVQVNLKLPDTLIINIVERTRKYFVFNFDDNKYYRLDIYGYILEVAEKLDEKEQHELLVEGITFDNDIVIGCTINEIDYTKLLVYEKIYEEFSKVLSEYKITKVVFKNSLTHIYLNDKIETILANDYNLAYTTNFLKQILQSLGDVSGTIDMTKDNPTYVSF